MKGCIFTALPTSEAAKHFYHRVELAEDVIDIEVQVRLHQIIFILSHYEVPLIVERYKHIFIVVFVADPSQF